MLTVYEPPAADQPANPRAITPIAFINLFTAEEELGIRTAAADPSPAGKVLAIWLGRIEDPRATTVDLDHPAVRSGVARLVAAGLLQQARAEAILAGRLG